MTPPLRKALLRGMLASAPFVIVVGPFALLFGVVATEAGLDVAKVMLFSISVFAGASQFAALQLMQENAPVLVILATSLAVNLRMVMYSVAMAPHLGAARPGLRVLMAYFLVDQSFAASSVEFEKRPDPKEARDLLAKSPGIEVVDFPMNIVAGGRDSVYVGRIRKDPSHDHGLQFWVVSDNLRKGAALNAIQIAERILA